MTIIAAPPGTTRAQHDLFGACRPTDLAAIDGLSTELAVAPGRVLLREGDPGSQFFVIRAGSARVTVGGRCIATVNAGSFVGEISMIDGGACLATVTAATPMHLLVFGPSEFRALMDLEIRSVTRHMLSTVAGRLRAADRGYPVSGAAQ